MSTPSAPRRTRPVRSPRPLRPDDVRAVVVVEELDVLPDGSAAVVARRVVRDGRYHRHLWLVDLVGRSAPRRLTSGAVRDGWPRVSPDGRTVAFVRADAVDDDAPGELCAVAIRTGGVRRLAKVSNGIGSFHGHARSPGRPRRAGDEHRPRGPALPRLARPGRGRTDPARLE